MRASDPYESLSGLESRRSMLMERPLSYRFGQYSYAIRFLQCVAKLALKLRRNSMPRSLLCEMELFAKFPNDCLRNVLK